ncbi:hypothetical protein ACA097_04335 [Pseudomonas sp. QL9]|nr:hypothetical protein [Pseudomonas knackmussii]
MRAFTGPPRIPNEALEDRIMQAALDFLLIVGSLAELLLYVAMGAIGLAGTLLLTVIAVLTLRSPGEPIRIDAPPRRRVRG